jgi:hypothetical protein
MKDIHQVLRLKRAQYAQLAKEIALLEDAARKLQEVAALLSDGEEDENAVLAEVDDDGSQPASMAATAAAFSAHVPASLAAVGATPDPAEAAKPRAPRWP